MAVENQANTEPLASTYGSPPAPKEPSVACGSEKEPPIGGPNDPIEEREAKTNGFQQQCIGQLINKDEKEFPKEHRKGREINTEEYQKIIHEREIELHTKSTPMAPENEAHTEPLASTHGSPPAPNEASVACGSEREPPIGGPSDLIEERDAKTGGFQQQYIGQLM
ncbi:hypothetical protein Cgig2_017515 [Carnegiea gigantea]|uniref:Uncharacterized protein n=1 Tax=Carnegiea gigantea TaxID=171969 RepID=A0A9Q1QBI9_9CARY|nr:hypothetical protein Cgig2_017515 [Carnegiea gigantea]